MKWFPIIVLSLLLSHNIPPQQEPLYRGYISLIPVVTAKRIKFEDIDLLARLIASEALLEPYEGKLAVGQVVLNRMTGKGQSMIEVVYAKGQFDGIRNKYFKKVPTPECLAAARALLSGTKVLPEDVYYYHNPRLSTDRKWVRYIERGKVVSIGNHTFCRKPTKKIQV